MDELTMRIGTPFVGADRQGLEKFLQRQGLDYDESITYTVLLESDSGIAACGSCHNNVINVWLSIRRTGGKICWAQ